LSLSIGDALDCKALLLKAGFEYYCERGSSDAIGDDYFKIRGPYFFKEKQLDIILEYLNSQKRLLELISERVFYHT